MLRLAAYPEPRSRWFMGDDLIYVKWRQYVAESFGLQAIEIVGADAQRPATTPDDDAP